MIHFSCPSCGKGIKVGDGGAGKTGKCPACRATVHVPETPPIAAQGPPPLKHDQRTAVVPDDAHTVGGTPKQDPCPDGQPAATLSVSAFIQQVWRRAQGLEISTCGAGIGLFLLAVSPFFKWINFGAGGVIGLAGDGKVVLGVTLLAAVALVAALKKGRRGSGLFRSCLASRRGASQLPFGWAR